MVTRQLIADFACASLGVFITSNDMIAADSLTGSAEESAAFDVWMRQRRGLVKFLINIEEILRIMQWIHQAHDGSVYDVFDHDTLLSRDDNTKDFIMTRCYLC